jgi:hypothetical protein
MAIQDRRQSSRRFAMPAKPAETINKRAAITDQHP